MSQCEWEGMMEMPLAMPLEGDTEADADQSLTAVTHLISGEQMFAYLPMRHSSLFATGDWQQCEFDAWDHEKTGRVPSTEMSEWKREGERE